MQFKYNDGAPQSFIITDNSMSWLEVREKRKIEFVSIDQVITEKVLDFIYVLDIQIASMTLTEKDNLSLFYENSRVSLDNEDEVDTGDTFFTYSGNLYVRRPLRKLNFVRGQTEKDIDFFNIGLEILADTRGSAVK